MHIPQNNTSDVTFEPMPPPPGSKVPTPTNNLATAVMCAIIGAMASGGGAVLGAVLNAWMAPPCTGMFCGLGALFYGGVVGWGLGILIAVGSSIARGGGTAVDKTARALSTILGVIALPVGLTIMLMLWS